MSKSHRGRGIHDRYKKGRGNCPVCKRTGVKTLYSYEHNGKNIEICKVCRAAISHGKKEEALSALA